MRIFNQSLAKIKITDTGGRGTLIGLRWTRTDTSSLIEEVICLAGGTFCAVASFAVWERYSVWADGQERYYALKLFKWRLFLQEVTKEKGYEFEEIFHGGLGLIFYLKEFNFNN